MKMIAAALLATGILSAAAQETKTFAGVVTDDVCIKGDHSHMRMGSNDGECATACVDAHGAAYVLFDGRNAYTLTGTAPIAKFAGKKVSVTGTLDARTKTIRVESITASR